MHRLSRLLLALATLLVSGLAHTAPAAAQGTYWSRADLLRSFFPKSERVAYRQLELSEPQRKTITRRLGYAAPKQCTIFYGLREGQIVGYAILDSEKGQHEPISFGVLTDTQGNVKRVEVMVYREAYGEEIRNERFRKQFKGKDANDALRPGRDIVTIAGATISSRALTTGTRRVLLLLDELVLKPHLTLVQAR